MRYIVFLCVRPFDAQTSPSGDCSARVHRSPSGLVSLMFFLLPTPPTSRLFFYASVSRQRICVRGLCVCGLRRIHLPCQLCEVPPASARRGRSRRLVPLRRSGRLLQPPSLPGGKASEAVTQSLLLELRGRPRLRLVEFAGHHLLAPRVLRTRPDQQVLVFIEPPAATKQAQHDRRVVPDEAPRSLRPLALCPATRAVEPQPDARRRSLRRVVRAGGQHMQQRHVVCVARRAFVRVGNLPGVAEGPEGPPQRTVARAQPVPQLLSPAVEGAMQRPRSGTGRQQPVHVLAQPARRLRVPLHLQDGRPLAPVVRPNRGLRTGHRQGYISLRLPIGLLVLRRRRVRRHHVRRLVAGVSSVRRDKVQGHVVTASSVQRAQVPASHVCLFGPLCTAFNADCESVRRWIGPVGRLELRAICRRPISIALYSAEKLDAYTPAKRVCGFAGLRVVLVGGDL
eukprot:Rhum_TRINITY_DN15222_c7_g1::Rhum_TRINITY_DN15222_c7_g1_i1::g.148423::m.148423